VPFYISNQFLEEGKGLEEGMTAVTSRILWLQSRMSQPLSLLALVSGVLHQGRRTSNLTVRG